MQIGQILVSTLDGFRGTVVSDKCVNPHEVAYSHRAPLGYRVRCLDTNEVCFIPEKNLNLFETGR